MPKNATLEQEQPPVADTNVETVQPRIPEEYNGLTITDRRDDPERAAAQRAAVLDYQRRQDPRSWTPLPNGEMIRVQGAVAPDYPGEVASLMLANPRGMLSRPNPDYEAITGGVSRIFPRYVWRVYKAINPADNRPAETSNLHRGNRIRYVETAEIDPDCEYAVYTEYATASNKYVSYNTMILCEILDPKLVYQKMKGWEDQGIARASQLQDTVRGERGTRIPNVTEVDVIGPQKSQRGR